MSGMACNYQKLVSDDEAVEALANAECHHCGVPAVDLMQKGQQLEVCGEEFASDATGAARVMTSVALCPACHRDYHLDAMRQHNPCQVQARYSREGL